MGHKSPENRENRSGGQSEDSTTFDESPESSPAEKPVSLHPLGFEKALRGLLKVKQAKGK